MWNVPKEIHFQLPLGCSLALARLGRSFQYFSEPGGRKVKAHTIRTAKQTTLAECRELTGLGQTMAWRDRDVHSFAVLYTRFWIWNEPPQAVGGGTAAGRGRHEGIHGDRKQHSLQQLLVTYRQHGPDKKRKKSSTFSDQSFTNPRRDKTVPAMIVKPTGSE